MTDLVLNEMVINGFGEKYFTSVNQNAFAKTSSEDVLAPLYQDYIKEEEALYIVVGTDSGLLKNYLETHREHQFCHFVFIELDSVIQALDMQSDSYESISDSDKNVWLFNEDFIFGQLNRAFGNYVIRRKIHLIKSLAVMDAEPGTIYADFWDKCEVAYSHYIRGEFNSQSAKVFEEQRFLNLGHNLIPAIEIENKLSGKDAIILGGGPTLDDAIDWVRDNQEKLIIFAAARIAKRMEKEGILVDFFVTVDPFPWSFDNSKSFLTHSDYSILIHSFHAQHRLISQWNGLSCYLGQRYGWVEEDEKINFDAPGPTVTNTALHIAATLGAKRMFLSGIDFCFAKGKTHESSSVEAQHKDTVAHHGKAMLEDNAGNMTETGDDFYSAKESMEAMIKYYLAHKPDLEFISLGLHSAKMDNVHYQPAETIDLASNSKEALIEEIKLELTLTPEEKQQLLTQAQSSLKSQKKRFENLIKNSDEALLVADKLYNKDGEIVEKQAKKIKKLQKKTNNLVGQDGDYITNYQAALFADAFKPIANEQAMTNDEVKEQLKAFFSGLNKVSKAILKLVDNGNERVQLSIDELNAEILPSSLNLQWKKWGEQGRAVQWKELHGLEKLSDDELGCIDEAMALFQHEFEKKDHQYQKRLENKINNVSRILARANNAFAKKDIAEIETIIEHVNGLESNNEEQKQDFISLLKGMVCELKDNKVDAFNYYEPIQLKFLKHIALKKMLPIAIALEDYEAALIVFDRLIQINLDYMVPYADMLKLLGNLAGAIEVLNMYLKQNPSKLSIKNRLAQYYLENKQNDQAEVLLKDVLSVDDNNKTALSLLELCHVSKQ